MCLHTQYDSLYIKSLEINYVKYKQLNMSHVKSCRFILERHILVPTSQPM